MPIQPFGMFGWNAAAGFAGESLKMSWEASCINGEETDINDGAHMH